MEELEKQKRLLDIYRNQIGQARQNYYEIIQFLEKGFGDGKVGSKTLKTICDGINRG
ncbi:uncharacterized protein G2W53_024995 [Senna tora]|uniref:Uncharacterized protein n=1 Tax=Senna tora TaxID=362788 RepID=A0A834TD05_9FABA|nr:uncharacterized protein G2W53_024995 [Senna tora]